MNKKVRNSLAQELRRQREVLFKEVANTEADLRFIEEDRESELEERAQEERMACLLARLDERGKQAIEEIDAALQRIAKGTYGKCEGCRQPIPVTRLRALPVTRFCVKCARRQEGAPPTAPGEKTPHNARVPLDLSLLTDSFSTLSFSSSKSVRAEQ
jgi:DnaK suppressor protein